MEINFCADLIFITSSKNIVADALSYLDNINDIFNKIEQT